MPHSPSRNRPRAIASALEQWFAAQQRDLPWRRNYDPYEVWVSEVMLQQTRMEVVVPYFLRFVERFSDVAALAAASVDEVTALWSGLGYYRRARMLHDGARMVVGQFGGVLPSTVDELCAIAGIGAYTAGAIASIAFQQRAAIVDGNVARVVARLEAINAALGSAALSSQAWQHAAELVDAADSPRALNQSLMELGALICTPRAPRCPLCPVSALCSGLATGEPQSFPAPRPAREKTRLTIPLFVVTGQHGGVLLERHSGALMDAMFHLPHGSDALLTSSAARFRAGRRIGSFRHTITHRAITFELFEADAVDTVAEGGSDQHWTHPDQPVVVAHPSYVKKAMKLICDDALRRGRSGPS